MAPGALKTGSDAGLLGLRCQMALCLCWPRAQARPPVHAGSRPHGGGGWGTRSPRPQMEVPPSPELAPRGVSSRPEGAGTWLPGPMSALPIGLLPLRVPELTSRTPRSLPQGLRLSGPGKTGAIPAPFPTCPGGARATPKGPLRCCPAGPCFPGCETRRGASANINAASGGCVASGEQERVRASLRKGSRSQIRCFQTEPQPCHPVFRFSLPLSFSVFKEIQFSTRVDSNTSVTHGTISPVQTSQRQCL